MTEKTESAEATSTAAATEAKLEKVTKPNRTAKPELPANVVRTELAHGTVLFNALAE